MLTTTVAGSRGAFTAHVLIPQAIEGTHHILAVGQHTGRAAMATLVVTPTMILTPTMGTPGSTVTISGYGFRHETVSVTWDSPAQQLGTRTANTVGSFVGTTALTVTIPLHATAGAHVITGVGQTSHTSGKAVFTIP